MKKLIIIIIALFLGEISLSAKTITVTSSENSGTGTLRQAIADAESNDSIIFADNIKIVYFAEMILIDKNITIIGNKTNNTFFQNASTGWTGTNLKNTRYFYIVTSVEAIFNHLTMRDNLSYCSGGAINNHGKLIVNRCTFSNNATYHTNVGGAIINSGSLVVISCIFSNNSSYSGGAIFSSGTAVITNSLFTGNSASTSGGAINTSSDQNVNAEISISNSTFAGNSAHPSYDQGGGAAISNWCKATLCNNIMWNSGDAYDITTVGDNGATTAYNNIIGTSTGPLSGTGNLMGTKPLFIGNGNYRLQAGSPAIDKGDNAYLDAQFVTDLADNPRIKNCTVDIGAYEYQDGDNICDSITALLNEIATLEQKNSSLHDSIVISLNNIDLLQDSVTLLFQLLADCESVSVHNSDITPKSNIEVYPNPARDRVVVTLPETTNSPIYLIDINGKLLKRTRSNSLNVEIDVSDIPTGAYIISAEQNGNRYSKQLIINK